MRVLNVVLETIQVLVTLTTFTNGTLVGFGGDAVIVFIKEVAMTVLIVILETIGILVSLITTRNRTFVRFISISI